jgi:hypothetical protein
MSTIQENAPARDSTEHGAGNKQRPEDTTPAEYGKAIDMHALDAETAADYYHPASERFLVRNPAGRWLPFSASSYKRLLASRGVAVTRAKGEPMAEADHLILQAQMENDVVRYGPLCGRDSGFYTENGIRHLVTEDMPLIAPQKGSCPIIRSMILGLFAASEDVETGDAQIHTFCGWLQSSVHALRAGRWQQQQVLAIAGPRDCGKSFMQHAVITPALAGRAVDAQRFLIRGNDFNGDLFNAEHLTLDDCAASTRIADRLAFGQRLKGVTVGASVGALHAKGRDAVGIRPWWRVTITCNDDPEALCVLPPLNSDIDDKLILLRASRFDMPMPTDTQADREALAAAILDEMPAFLHWLINVYELPEQYHDRRRYGVATYHHPVLREAIDGLSPEAELLDLIDGTLAADLEHGAKWITAEDLENRIRDRNPIRAAQVFTYRQACAKYLHRLSVKMPDRVTKGRTAASNGWWIHPKGPFVEGVEGD